MTVLRVLVENPAKWLHRMADHSGGLAVAMVMVGTFAVVNLGVALLGIELPQIEQGFAWAWRLGIVLGVILALGAGLVLWLYLTVGAFLTLSLTVKVVSLARLTRLTGIFFAFPLVGKLVILLLWAADLPILFQSIYLTSVSWGIAVLTRAMARASDLPWSETVFALIVPIIVLELALLAIRFL